jgi:hypothetical protein
MMEERRGEERAGWGGRRESGLEAAVTVPQSVHRTSTNSNTETDTKGFPSTSREQFISIFFPITTSISIAIFNLNLNCRSKRVDADYCIQ